MKNPTHTFEHNGQVYHCTPRSSHAAITVPGQKGPLPVVTWTVEVGGRSYSLFPAAHDDCDETHVRDFEKRVLAAIAEQDGAGRR
jgi:hypothetical protein